VIDNILTRRAALRAMATTGVALAAAAALPALPALAAEPANKVVVNNFIAPIAGPAARSTVDLDSLTEAEHDTALAFCGLAGVLLTDDEAAATLAAACYASDADPNLDFDGLLTAVDGERLMLGLRDRRATEARLRLTDERRMAGVLVGLGFVRGMPSDLFDLVHARRLEEMPDLFAA
jgi:hypothetical protein